MPPWERAAAGLHLVMQYPTEVPGVALDDMLREALAARGRDRRARRHAARRGRADRPRGAAAPPAAQRRPVRRREEAQRDAAAGGAGAPHRHPRRARLRSRHRRPAGLRPAHRGGPSRPDGPGSACWRSPTTTACSPSCARRRAHPRARPDRRRRRPELADASRPRATPPFAEDDDATSRRPGLDELSRGVRPGSLDELFSTR